MQANQRRQSDQTPTSPTRRFSRGRLAVAAFVCLAVAARLLADEAPAPSRASPTADAFPQGQLLSAEGARSRAASLRGSSATVFVAMSTECPISNGYVPTLNRLAKRYAKRGVAVIGINPNAGQSLRDIKAHAKEYHVAFPLLKDAGAKVASQLGLTLCPETCVLDDQGAVRYRGRIDDRFWRRGGAAVRVRRGDLELAIKRVLSGGEGNLTTTKAVGCPIHTVQVKPAAAGDAKVTYCRQISRILQSRCLECHRSNAIGPFSLESYEQAVNWAEDIQRFTAERIMPPWKPVEGHGDFVNVRRMPQAEIDLIDDWVSAGCPQGAKSDLPPKREFPTGWRLGEPDLVLRSTEAFDIGADGPDVYQCFVLPTGYPSDQYVVALEVRPSNYRVTHHVLVYTDTKKQARQLDQRSPEPGYASSQGFPGFMPSGILGGWAPGNIRQRLPEGMAKLLPRGADVVVQVHYHKTGKPESDNTEVGLYFAKRPVTRLVSSIPVMPPGGPFSDMRIPAGASDHPVRASFELPDDALAICVTPHMHLLGKAMRVTATLPDGSTRPIVWIRDWDFNWQETYVFREPVTLPAGTRLDLLAHYDNTADNPNNPHDPPRRVRWGDQTEDEMCIAFIEVASQFESHDPAELRKHNPARKVGSMLREQIAEKLRARLNPGEFWRRLSERWKQRAGM